MTDADHPHRRSTDVPVQPVEIDVLRYGAKKFADQLIVLVFGVFLAFVTGFPAILWAGSRWTGRIEGELKTMNSVIADVQESLAEHMADNEKRVGAIAEGVQQIDKTMTRVVTNQENLQARVERLERNDDSEHRNN